MVERICPRCSSRIVIEGKHVKIFANPKGKYSIITCSECKKWILNNL